MWTAARKGGEKRGGATMNDDRPERGLQPVRPLTPGR
jgi:hypothetical protein